MVSLAIALRAKRVYGALIHRSRGVEAQPFERDYVIMLTTGPDSRSGDDYATLKKQSDSSTSHSHRADNMRDAPCAGACNRRWPGVRHVELRCACCDRPERPCRGAI